MNHNRLLPFHEIHLGKDDICKYFIKHLGTDSPEYKLLKNNIIQISDPKTGKIFDKYLCILHNEKTFSSLKQNNCFLLVNEDVESGIVIIYAINPEDYQADIYEEAFMKALCLIDNMMTK